MTGRALSLEPGTVPATPVDGIDRLFLGSETCPWLLPTPAEAQECRELTARWPVPVTLVTSWLPGERLEAAVELATEGRGWIHELVVNDWGLLRRARLESWPVSLCLGRLLLRSSVGGDEREAGSGARETVIPGMLADLAEWGISGVLLDAATAGVVPAARAAGLRVIWVDDGGLVTVAGRCPWRFDAGHWASGPCHRPCRVASFELLRRADERSLVVRGRGQFLGGCRGRVPEGIDTVVTSSREEA